MTRTLQKVSEVVNIFECVYYCWLMMIIIASINYDGNNNHKIKRKEKLYR